MIRQAGVMLIIKDGLILGISRRYNKNIFGLPGGSYDENLGDSNTKETAIRETIEETGIIVKDCVLIFERIELGDGPDGVDYYSRCYYALDWIGEPHSSEEGNVEWLTSEELISTKAAFADYNSSTLKVFREMFPNVLIK